MGPRDPKSPASFPQIVIAAEHYNRIFRTIEKKIPVTLEMDVDNRFYDEDLNSFNIVGEIRGTDLAHEVVMVGAHFDSWHSGTGATDNAAGSAVMLEAMRILKATRREDAPHSPHRTLDRRGTRPAWIESLRAAIILQTGKR